jgi:hypothetical protein
VAYAYSQDDAERYRRKIHDLAGQLQAARCEMETERSHHDWLYKMGRDAIGGGGYTHFSYVDAHTAGMCLEYLGRKRALVLAERALYSPNNHGWLGELSRRLCGSYAWYWKWHRLASAIVGSWRFFVWRLKGGT